MRISRLGIHTRRRKKSMRAKEETVVRGRGRWKIKIRNRMVGKIRNNL
jgi:hypothetical protein